MWGCSKVNKEDTLEFIDEIDSYEQIHYDELGTRLYTDNRRLPEVTPAVPTRSVRINSKYLHF